ncbi:UPF0481 protein At3g47200-like isoform X2 [Cornus florida]|nr:UPF0481 protein At3g47200-like isoform X2 [Cornus florida]
MEVNQEIERQTDVSIEIEDVDTENLDMVREAEALIPIKPPHDPVVTSIREMLEGVAPLSPDCSIYKVPEKLQKVNGEAYTPRVVSIGPLHHGQKSLQAMEEHKLRYLQSFLSRTILILEDIVRDVRMWEERARRCYAEAIELSSDDFVKMILVDASFIVEVLLRSYFPQFIEGSDRIFHKPCMIDDIGRDMLLLDNQLPFFVLEGFLTLVFVSDGETFPSILDLTHQHFKNLLNIGTFPNTISSTEVKHFLDFLRFCYLPLSPRVWQKSSRMDRFSPSASSLHDAGIKFKVGTGRCLLDIKFANGVIEIPHLEIDDLTEILFRNLIAFEQCHYAYKYIIQYMALMDSMINTPKDVELLIHHKIITSRLGSNEDISTLFNKICKEVVLGHNFYFLSLCDNLNAYCTTPWHKWKATLKRDYFNKPWAIVSVIAAIVLLILTFVQAVCSLISI